MSQQWALMVECGVFDDEAVARAAMEHGDEFILPWPLRALSEQDTDLLWDCAAACQRHGLDGTARRLSALAARLV